MSHAPNPYDIDLVRLYYLAKYQVDYFNIPVTQKTKYKAELLKDIKQYCRLNSSNFKTHLFGPVPLVIKPEDHLYHKFLPFTLLHMDINKIAFFLNHHQRVHKGSYLIPQNKFVEYIESEVCGQIEKLSIIDTRERIQEIRKWIDFNKTKKPVEPHLEWIDPSKYDLDRLSETLFVAGYTNTPEDFKKIFSENKKTQWMKSIEELAYLFYYLKSNEMIKVVAIRGYLKHLEYIFDHLEIAKTERYGLNGVLIRIKGRSREMKAQIEGLVNESFFTRLTG